MKTKGEKVGELIDALNNGCILYREFGEPVFENKEYLFRSGDYYEIRGWGTAFGDIKDRVYDVLQQPDTWKIFPDFNMKTDEYPFPWSSTWKEKEEIKPKGLSLTLVLIEDEEVGGYTGYFKEIPNLIADRDTKERIIESLTNSLHDIFRNALNNPE